MSEPVPSHTRTGQRRNRGVRALANTLLIPMALIFVTPLAWIILASVNPQAQVSLTWPKSVTVDNFAQVATWEISLRPLLNSLILSLICAVVTVLCSLLAAYPLSRYRMRSHRILLYIILFGSCLPITAMMVPVYGLFVSMNWIDNPVAVAIFLAATSLPMAVWMTKNFMDSIPISLEEAAWVDGAGSMKALRHVVIPLMRSGIAVVFMFVFTGAWGNFFVPFILLQSASKNPAAVAIYGAFGSYGTVNYGQVAAFSVLYSVPVLLLYLVAQKVAGNSFAMAGAVKG